MGRNGWTEDSSLIISKENYKNVLNLLLHEFDEDKSTEKNLEECLHKHSIFLQSSDSEYMIFEVEDDDEDSDFSYEFLGKLAPYLDEGSFYNEESPDGIERYDLSGDTLEML